MSIAVSIFMLLLFGAVGIAVLLFFVKIFCEGAVGIMGLAINQSNQLEKKSGKMANMHDKKLTKIEMQIESILGRHHF